MSLYTLTINDSKNLLSDSIKDLIRTDVDFVIRESIDRFIDWKGTMDFRVNIKTNAEFFKEVSWAKDIANSDGCLPGTEMAWVGSKKSNLIEATTGKDANGSQSDAGFTIYLGVDGTVKLFGVPLWLDPNPVYHQTPSIPNRQYDFVSVALHEIIHTMAFDGVTNKSSPFGALSTRAGNFYNFNGPNVQALLGGPLPITPDNHVVSQLNLPYKDSGLMRNYGNYDANRWDIGRIELAVMKDLGFDVNGSLSGLSYTDIDDKRTGIVGTAAADKMYGDFQNNAITGLAGDDSIDGGAGNDSAYYSAERANYSITKTASGYTVTDNSGSDGEDRLISVESLVFTDQTVSTADTAVADSSAPIFNAALSSANDAPLSGPLLLVFDEAISLGVGQVRLLDAKNKSVAGSVSVDGNQLAFTPSAALNFYSSYAISVEANAVQDLAGNSVAAFSQRILTTDTFSSNQAAVTLAATAKNLQYTGNGDFAGTGNALANAITGGAGNDTLTGAAGNDTISGGAGNDVFVFNSKPGAANVDTLADFSAGDKLALSGMVFSKLKADTDLSDNLYFIAPSNLAAQDSNDFLLYEQASGRLSYDADANGAKAAVLIAIIGSSSHAAISATDLFMI